MDIQRITVAMASSTKENSSDRFNSHNGNVGTPFLVNCLHKVTS